MISFQEAIKFIKRYLFEPVEFPDDKVATDFLVRHAPPAKVHKPIRKAVQENGEILSDDGGDKSDLEDNDLDGFIVGGDAEDDEDGERAPRHKRKHTSKPSSRKRRKGPIDLKDRELEELERGNRRRQLDLEKALRQYKSADYVNESDDEADPEELKKFFESEKQLRENFNAGQIYEKPAAAEDTLMVEVAPTQVEKDSDNEAATRSNVSDGELEESNDELDDSDSGNTSTEELAAFITSPQHENSLSRTRKIILDSDEED